MKIPKKWLHGIQWANVGVMALNILNQAMGTFPALAENKTALIAQGILAALLPSLGGVANVISTQPPQPRGTQQ